MSKIPTTFSKGTSSFEYQTTRTVNGNLEYGLNVKSTLPTPIVSPATANEEFTVNHDLGFVPNGYHVLSKDQTCDIIASRKSQWTTSQMYLTCTVASVNLVLVAI